MTTAAAFATAQGWSTSAWTEMVVVVGALVVIAVAGWIVVALVVAAALRAASVIVAPEQPPGLERINAIFEQQRAEAEAAAAAASAADAVRGRDPAASDPRQRPPVLPPARNA
jgi:hypothetical protein